MHCMKVVACKHIVHKHNTHVCAMPASISGATTGVRVWAGMTTTRPRALACASRDTLVSSGAGDDVCCSPATLIVSVLILLALLHRLPHAGASCEAVTTEFVCKTNCSNRGTCITGFCHCQEGFWGMVRMLPLCRPRLLVAASAHCVVGHWDQVAHQSAASRMLTHAFTGSVVHTLCRIVAGHRHGRRSQAARLRWLMRLMPGHV
jgi:hypothetical protein